MEEPKAKALEAVENTFIWKRSNVIVDSFDIDDIKILMFYYESSVKQKIEKNEERYSRTGL